MMHLPGVTQPESSGSWTSLPTPHHTASHMAPILGRDVSTRRAIETGVMGGSEGLWRGGVELPLLYLMETDLRSFQFRALSVLAQILRLVVTIVIGTFK